MLCEFGERTEASAERAEETLGGDVATLDERLEPGGVALEVDMGFIDDKASVLTG